MIILIGSIKVPNKANCFVLLCFVFVVEATSGVDVTKSCWNISFKREIHVATSVCQRRDDLKGNAV